MALVQVPPGILEACFSSSAAVVTHIVTVTLSQLPAWPSITPRDALATPAAPSSLPDMVMADPSYVRSPAAVVTVNATPTTTAPPTSTARPDEPIHKNTKLKWILGFVCGTIGVALLGVFLYWFTACTRGVNVFKRKAKPKHDVEGALAAQNGHPAAFFGAGRFYESQPVPFEPEPAEEEEESEEEKEKAESPFQQPTPRYPPHSPIMALSTETITMICLGLGGMTIVVLAMGLLYWKAGGKHDQKGPVSDSDLENGCSVPLEVVVNAPQDMAPR
ncbi:hypothetical protein BDV95DRAFT_607998 [Massariosphaeria phaeospora]|uniref:Uncharacterized protein n=1 Tax=Massariosphaeria phaeospora TaxID=100035 RepID=A0A7C8MJL2_9PLEO|nr:hypothetical protein BDV95DRAFT_607998 [Massariosphaeria phaeospora]